VPGLAEKVEPEVARYRDFLALRSGREPVVCREPAGA
jgi:hypothetical protein